MCRVQLTWPQYQRRALCVDGIEYRLTPKLIELAFLLISRRGDFVPMPQIIEFLWPDPDAEPDFSEDVIRTYASRLRKYLPPGSLVARAVTASNLMDAGHYLHGALMLQKEPMLQIQQPKRKKRRAKGVRSMVAGSVCVVTISAFATLALNA